MDVMEILLGAGATILSAGILSCLHLLRKVDRRLAVDDLRWEQNTADHERAFKEIDNLKAGQIRIEKKLGEMKTQLEVLKNG